MSRKLVTYPEEILSRKAEPVAEINDYIRDLAGDMAEIMYQNRGIGLAAPQVGEGLRLITVDLSGPDKRDDLMVLVNPEIIDSQGESESEEGCLSVVGYKSSVCRAEKIRVRALDLKNNQVILDADDLLATCLQHEIDHLDGILFIDRISRLKRKMYDKKLSRWIKTKKD
ncbi:peptide deformylase [Desulfonatronovibrio hydrogenovorans]|uniref:peptide deformylase n=1 Tax=Desulfonatronovibrio hydrogenovorans TaxID=53245 RepID=UPI00048B4FAD|nr:peptide deformylase [Desulfonatronovibrio hydrogenovorans]